MPDTEPTDQATSQQPAIPQQQATSAAPAIPQPAISQPAIPQPAGTPEEPTWLPARLERERKSILRELGVEGVDDAKEALAELKKRRDAEKTEAERMKEELALLRGKSADVSELRATVEQYATTAMATLTDEQRAVVLQIAGDSPSKQLSTIQTLKPTWKTEGAIQQPTPAPATTMQTAPAPSATTSPADNPLTVHEELQKRNPVRAAQYYLRHATAIEAAQKARA